MLNKLLKRCMPWMDKGRWYSIRLEGSDPSNIRTVFNTDEFINAEINFNNGIMTVTCKHVFQIVENRFCPNGDFAYYDGQLKITRVVEGNNFSNYKFNIELCGAGTYWFFMR